ncbi:MAG: zinc ribbon domain-containing protein [Mogibacterium sp.]|nr:zinc ribbon domain-containing protein [Mogibacterium sp.]
MEVMNGIRCPNCGMMNEADDLFCGNCGTKLDAGPKQTPAYAPPQSASHIAAPVSASAGAGANPEKGKGQATASLVLGIIAVVCWFFGYSAIVSVGCGIAGLILAGKAKSEGFEGGMRTAGFVLSLIGLIGGAVVLVACVACVGSLGMLGASLY